jgi:chromosome segregation ATPase
VKEDFSPLEVPPIPPEVVAPMPPKAESLSDILADKTPPKKMQEDKLGKILQEVKQERDEQSHIKDLATESEKQQIFLLQSKKADLQKEIAKGDQQNNVMSEKNRLLSEKKDWQEKLSNILQEQKNAATEKQKEDIEKKKWSVESELVKLESKIKDFDQNNEQLEAAQNNVKAEIADTEDLLKTIYANISQRQQAVKQEPSAPIIPKALERPEIFTAPMTKEQAPKIPVKSTFKETPVIEQSSLQSREYLKQVPAAAMEKLEKSTEIEEKQRLKFMEDVEKWVALTNGQEEKNN